MSIDATGKWEESMSTRIISVSGAPYDGYSRDIALESAARLGFRHFEPAFIVGYTERFDETAFTSKEATAWRASLKSSDLECHAFSSHIDLGFDDSPTVFSGRMEFAAELGARVIATNASARSRETNFLRNLEVLLRRAERLNIIIALENPGDGSDNVINTASQGIELVDRIGSPYLRLNYDAANTASHKPDVADFVADAIMALPASAHAHIKDVRRTEDGWHFAPIGDGDVGCVRILDAIRPLEDFPLSIELPLRLHRGSDAQPIRRTEPVPLATIEDALSRSLEFVRRTLDGNK